MLHGKKVIVGVTASIAAYKSAYIIRLLKKRGAEVKVIMTGSSTDFITPLTLATLAENPVYSDFTEDEDKGTWTNHVALGLWADLMLVAPATANSLSKMANGEADNFLIATYLSAKCPVYIAPAMDLDMYRHPSTQENIQKLESFGNTIIHAESGELASGLVGKGRLAEPENIIDFIEKKLKSQLPLYGQKVMITAGPTYEAIDPVRFIGNRSTGKMGYAIAHEASKQGADVTLISGPSHQKVLDKTIQLKDVESAEQMYNEVIDSYENQDIIIMSAAVADYTPIAVSDQKIKKKEGNLNIELKRTKDILAHLGKHKNDKQLLVGFALETQNAIENAKAKLQRKNADFIVLNSLEDDGAGFAHDTNKIIILDKYNNIERFELKDKKKVAVDIVNTLIKHANQK